MRGAVKTNAPIKRPSLMNATVKFKNASAQPPRIKNEIVLKISSQNFGAWKLLKPSQKQFYIYLTRISLQNYRKYILKISGTRETLKNTNHNTPRFRGRAQWAIRKILGKLGHFKPRKNISLCKEIASMMSPQRWILNVTMIRRLPKFK